MKHDRVRAWNTERFYLFYTFEERKRRNDALYLFWMKPRVVPSTRENNIRTNHPIMKSFRKLSFRFFKGRISESFGDKAQLKFRFLSLTTSLLRYFLNSTYNQCRIEKSSQFGWSGGEKNSKLSCDIRNTHTYL